MRPTKMKQMWREGRWVTMGWPSVSHGFTVEVIARQGFERARHKARSQSRRASASAAPALSHKKVLCERFKGWKLKA